MSKEAGAARYGVVIVTSDDALEQFLRELLATMMPSASLERLDLARAPSADADAMIVDEGAEAGAGATTVQEIRGRGYGGGVVLLTATCDAAMEHRLLALSPARCVARAAMASELPAALAELSARPALSDELGPMQRELRRTQQLIAMGAATSRVQHTLNNPLTALLAEAQLLEMEELAEEHRAAVKRIIESCRRLVSVVRGLDTGPPK